MRTTVLFSHPAGPTHKTQCAATMQQCILNAVRHVGLLSMPAVFALMVEIHLKRPPTTSVRTNLLRSECTGTSVTLWTKDLHYNPLEVYRSWIRSLMHLHLETCQQSRPWECGNPEGVSKECGKGGKPASWLSRLSILCHFHRLLGSAFHKFTITLRARPDPFQRAIKLTIKAMNTGGPR
jgi:hypothetical protein